jgi:hypothetical protein
VAGLPGRLARPILGGVRASGTASRSGLGRVVGPAIAVGAITALAYAAADLVRPRPVDIRSFDPDEVARLETAMWRCYYDHRPLPMFAQLVSLLRRQFHLVPSRAALTAGLAARAAVVFQSGHERADYVRALPLLRRYYDAIRQCSEVPFDPERAAALELEWWIVHRDAARLPAGALASSLAELAAELYQVPADRLTEHAERRAAAMVLCDQAIARGATETDWPPIEDELRAAWRSLRAAV